MAFLKLNDTKVTTLSYQEMDSVAKSADSLKYAQVNRRQQYWKSVRKDLKMNHFLPNLQTINNVHNILLRLRNNVTHFPNVIVSHQFEYQSTSSLILMI